MTISDTFKEVHKVFMHLLRWARYFGVVLACAFLFVVIVMAIAPGRVSHYDPQTSDFLSILTPPSSEHLFGTDALGRDVLTRIVYGARYSVTIGGGAVLLGAMIALPLGLLAGVSGKMVDEYIMRFTDVVGAFPEMLLAILVVSMLGPGVGNLVVALGIATSPKMIRVIRAYSRTIMTSGYVEYAMLLGQKRPRTILIHVLPNAIGPLPVLMTISLGFSIISAASLSFLGLGPRPPTPEWGLMLSDALRTLRVAWWVGVFPGLMITGLVISLTTLANGLQSFFERRVV